MMCWMFCNEQSTSIDEDNDEMKELLGVHYVSIGHFFKVLSRDLNSPYTQDVSISLCPGVACGAWKHAPIIPLPNYHALIVHAQPFFSFHSQTAHC